MTDVTKVGVSAGSGAVEGSSEIGRALYRRLIVVYLVATIAATGLGLSFFLFGLDFSDYQKRLVFGFIAPLAALPQVIADSTWHPAREIRQDGLGHLSPGAVADIAVLRLEKGRFGFLDMYGARLAGTERLVAEMTLKDGRIVYELNGLSRPDWTTLPADYKNTGDPAWDATRR